MMHEKYYLKADFMDEEKEVTKEEFIRAEQAAGFRSKFGPNSVATGSFAGGGVSGRTKYVADEETNDEQRT